MGGGDLEEDPKRELERLERDLAAIDARWSSEGYQQRTTSRVLDDERKTRRELARRIAELRGLPPPLTPAAGTVALNVGSAWRPLAVSEAPPKPEGAVSLPPFDVTDDEEVPPPLEELERELHELLTKYQYSYLAQTELGPITRRFRKTPGALRLLAAAWGSTGRSDVVEQLGLPPRAMQSYAPRVVRHPLLTEATELPNETTGLTPTQTLLMRVLRQCAPETGPFLRASEVFTEVRAVAPEMDEGRFTRQVSLLGHPSLRRLPLVSFQGFVGRVSATPSFSHVRLTPIGREVIDGTFPLPNLLANGASGDGVCLLPMSPSELAKCCLKVFETNNLWHLPGLAFDLPEGTRSAVFGFRNAMFHGHEAKILSRPVVSAEKSANDRRCRLLIESLPWPHTVADFAPELERLMRLGVLDGVTGFVDESSSDATRLAIEIEHVAFLAPIEQKLRNSALFEAHYIVQARVPAWPPSDREYSVPSLTDFIRAFLESRKEAAVKKFDADVLKFVVEAQRMEAVCVALAMITRVQGVLRETLDDAEGEQALMKCMRSEDRSALTQLPFPASHDYATGFTQDQARYLVKKRKLAATPAGAARTDWMRALDALAKAKQTLSDRGSVMDVVHEELNRAVERFGNEPRRSRPFT